MLLPPCAELWPSVDSRGNLALVCCSLLAAHRGNYWGELGYFRIERGINALQLEAGDCWYVVAGGGGGDGW